MGAKVRFFFQITRLFAVKLLFLRRQKRIKMRYTIKCRHCGERFAAETDRFGEMKYRCPYCQEVMMCAFNPAQPFWTRARSVAAVAGALPVGADGGRLPSVPCHVLTAMDSLQSAGGRVLDAGLESGRRIHSRIEWLLDHLTIFFGVSFARVRRFRAEYTDADLWLFFGFAVLFVCFAVAGIFICAQATKMLVSSHTWLLHELPFLHRWL